MADQAFMSELRTWLRFSPRRAVSIGDGLFGACSGSPALPEWLGPLALDLFFTAESESKKYTRRLHPPPVSPSSLPIKTIGNTGCLRAAHASALPFRRPRSA